jgi:hypothetical protein
MKKKNPVAIPVPGKSALSENPIPEKPPLEQKFGLSTQVKVEGSSEEMTVSKFVQKNAKEPDQLIVNLSHSLLRKLKEQALDEGISLEEFVTELLSEGVVLRAWEIVERKNQMKGHNPSAGSGMGGNNRHSMPNGNQSGNSNRNGNQRGGNKGHRGMSHMRYQTIMEDKATFLEYVRNQERTRR